MTRIVFMGTPDFAVPALQTLVAGGEQVVGVVTQPDRPQGRGKQLRPSPVKVVAQQAGLTLLQPESVKTEAAQRELAALKPELIVVAAFGQILRPEVLRLPPHGCLNLHASLLPRWRGAAPVAAAIRAGDRETGITLMLMDEGLDTGPMIAKRSRPIQPADTTGSLTAALAELGAALLRETLPAWLAGQIKPQAQDPALASLAPRLKKEAGVIDWSQAALDIERQVRAFDPWPGTFTLTPRGPLKILAVGLAPDLAPPDHLPPGSLFQGQKQVYVVTGAGALQLVTVQPAGKKAMDALAMLNGQPELWGTRLGLDHV